MTQMQFEVFVGSSLSFWKVLQLLWQHEDVFKELHSAYADERGGVPRRVRSREIPMGPGKPFSLPVICLVALQVARDLWVSDDLSSKVAS